MTKIIRGAAAATETGSGDSLESPSSETPKPAARGSRPLVPPRAPRAAKNQAKVLLSVIDGKIEWDKMTADSRKQFEDLFKDPKFLEQFGLTGKEKMFDPEQIKYLYDGISAMYQTVIGLLLRWPAAALKMLAYNDEQKNSLAVPTANLANKYASKILMQNQELIVWGAVFTAITQQNFRAAKETAEKMALAAKQRAAAPGHGSTRVDPNVGPQRVAPIAPADQPAPDISLPLGMPDFSGAGSLEGAAL
jgi:hypothetical protein